MGEEKHYDIEQSYRFLRLLDPDQGEFCFQLFKKTPEKEFEKPAVISSLSALETSFALAQQNRWNVTVTISETSAAGRALADISKIRVAFLDFDKKLIGQTVKYRNGTKVVEPLDIDTLIKSKFPPHLIVESSPGNLHAYWALHTSRIGVGVDKVEEAAESFRELQSNIAQFFGGDPGVTGLNQCVRLPGWWRFKDDDNAEPSLVHIIWHDENDVRYNPAALLDGFRKLNKPQKKYKPMEGHLTGGKKADVEEKEANSAPSNQNFGSDEGRNRAHKWLDKACEEMASRTEGGRDNLLNEICWTAGGYIAGGYLDEEETLGRLREAAIASGLDNSRIKDKLKRVVAQGKHRPIHVEENVISMEKPKQTTDRLIETSFLWHTGRHRIKTCRYWRSDFWIYENGRYRKKSDDEMTAFLRSWLNGCKRRIKLEDGNFRSIDFEAKSSHWVELFKQLAAATQLPDTVKINTWLPGALDHKPISTFVAFTNGIFDCESQTLIDANPAYFNSVCVNHEYDENIEPPKKWLEFLDQGFMDDEGVIDQQAIDLLQEWFGYCLTGDVSRQKMMLIVGPTRSGKGTIERVFHAVLGDGSIGSFDLPTMCGDFGMENMWGKSLNICSDVRDMARDLDKIVERLLRISANDPVPVNRKRKAIVDEQMNTKLMMFSNRIPSFSDPFGAMNARTLIIQMHQSFLGREDIFLSEKLAAEAQQIAHWALKGLQRLLKKGTFTLPKSAEDARAEFRSNDSPLFQFMLDRVEIDPNISCNKDALFEEYRDWAEINGFKFTKNKLTFFRELAGTHGGYFKTVQAAPGTVPRISYIKGIGLARDKNRGNWTPTNPPQFDRPRRQDGAYDERNPPPF